MMNRSLIKMLSELEAKGEELILVKLRFMPDVLEVNAKHIRYEVISKKIGDGYETNANRNYAVRTWISDKNGEGHFEGGYYGNSLNESEFSDYAKIVNFRLR